MQLNSGPSSQWSHQDLRHDSVIYSRSERPADGVHLHARSVPANLGRRISERMGRLTLKVCGPRVTFQMHWPMGFHISTWVGVHIYIWMFAGCSQQIDQNSSADYTL